MNVMSEEGRERVRCDEPKLGTVVELVEGSVGEVLDIRDSSAGELLVWQVLALSLRIDGQRYDVDGLRALGASRIKVLMRLARQAMRLNGYDLPEDEAKPGEGDEGPKA